MIYLCPSDSAITSLAMTNQSPSDVYVERSKTGTGSGSVGITGGFNGASDSVVEVEVVDSAGATRPHTDPQILGVGNGALAVSVAGSVAPQSFTLTLRDAGSPAQSASAQVLGVTLRAVAAGTAGNGITLSIASGWTQAATPYSVPEPIGAGAAQIGIGAAWNFGAPDLLDDGTVPATAPYIRFGDDAFICRTYRTFSDGQYAYWLTPAPPRNIPAGVPVWAMSGGVTATLRQGATVETYGPHATIFALLNAIRQGSTLVGIDGVVADDRRPGQMGIAPVSLRTDGHIQSSIREGSRYIREAAVVASAQATASTEVVTVECVETRTGAELWKLRGAISGALGEVRSGETFSGGPIASLVIPQAFPAETGAARGSIELAWQPSGPDSPDCMLLWRPIVGRNATSKSLTFVYTERQRDDCECEDQPIAGLPNPACLGVGLDGEGSEMDALAGVKEIQRKAVVTYFANLIESTNVAVFGAGKRQTIETSPQMVTWTASFLPDETPVQGSELVTDGQQSVKYASESANVARTNAFLVQVVDAMKTRVLAALSAALDATTFPPVWTPETNYTFGQLVRRTEDVYTRWWQAGGYGTSDDTEPTWNTTLAATTTDNDITWTAHASRYQEWLTVWAAAQTAITSGLPGAWIYADIEGANPDIIARRFTEDFDLASGKSDANSLTGTDCWQDIGGRYWWVNAGGPYKPIFTNVFYHSVIDRYTESGSLVVEETREFGLAIQTCETKLQPGDRVVITINADGVSQLTYQVGDALALQLVRGEAVATAGGRNAVATQVWSVRGSAVGGLADYTISNPASPTEYSASGLTMTLTQGAIPFRLGDQITFAAEGARVRWRRDGGSWSATADIAPLSIGDGMTLAFTGGAAPAWVPGDRWVIDALAVHGPSRMLSPRADGVGKWSAESDMTAAVSGPVRVAALLGVTGVTAAELVASDDNFSTEAARVTMSPAADGWCAVLPAALTHAKWRVEATGGGTAQWLYIGPGRQPTLPTGKAELGVTELSESITPRGIRRSATVAHTVCSYSSVRALLSAMGAARATHDGIVGAVEDADASSASRYRAPDRIDIDDRLGHQPEPARRLVSATVTLGSI